MVDSHEFTVQILPGLVATTTGFRAEKPFFFLHIPKTGGTSIRLLLGEAAGVPALNLYGAWPDADKSLHSFWPVWAGHAQISYFPDSHSGFTLFREPRARLLSQYRQQEAARTLGRFHGWQYNGRAFPRERKVRPFSEFLKDYFAEGRATFFRYFMPFAGESIDRIQPPEVLKGYMKMSAQELLPEIEKGVSRIDRAAWLHDPEAISNAVQQLTGVEYSELPRKNTYESKQVNYRPQRISGDDMRILEAVAKLDGLVLRIAAERGLVPAMSTSESDQHFESNARRLGFHF